MGQSVMIGTTELSFALLFLLGLFLLHMAIRNPETVPGAGETMAFAPESERAMEIESREFG